MKIVQTWGGKGIGDPSKVVLGRSLPRFERIPTIPDINHIHIGGSSQSAEDRVGETVDMGEPGAYLRDAIPPLGHEASPERVKLLLNLGRHGFSLIGIASLLL